MINLFAVELAQHPDAVELILATHVPNRDGKCVSCTKAGTGIPSEPWPCALRFHAAAADQMMPTPLRNEYP